MCVNPLVRFRLKVKPTASLERLCPLFLDEGYKIKNKGFRIISKKKLQSFFDNHGQYLVVMDKYCDYIEIPCGRCIECRKSYARDWSVRCYHESLYHPANCFITLTIGDGYVKLFDDKIFKSFNGSSNYVCRNCVNGSRFYRYPINYSLNKGLILGWIKDFRDYLYRHYKINIRYFGCGEYGSDDFTSRPHYHLLVYGYNFPTIYKDKKIVYNTFESHFSKKGVKMRISEELQHLWPYGASYVEDLNIFACQYVAQYCMKKVKSFDSEPTFDYYYGRVPEFLFMSRGNCQVNRCKYIDDIIKGKFNSLRNFYIPYCRNCDKTRGGLGYQWICDYMDDVRRLGYIVINGKKFPVPEYYKKLINLTDSILYDKLCSDNIYYVQKRLEDYPDENSIEQCQVRNQILKNKCRMYVRNVVS